LFLSNAHAAENEAVGSVLSRLFEGTKFDTGSNYVNAQFDRVKSFYAKRNYKPLWTRDNGPKGKAKALVGELRTSAVHGLSPEFYNLDKINSLMGSTDPEQLARLELLLSGALVEFGDDLANGRIGPDYPGSMNTISPTPIMADEYIQEAEAAGDLRKFMGGLLQSDKRYVRLISKLLEFIRLDGSGMWPEISADGGEIPAGKSDQRLVPIRKLLVLTGDLPISAMKRGEVHDETSIAAVKKFQLRFGISPSGDLDNETLAAIAGPLKSRIQKIKIELERRRWQVGSAFADHVYVNLAVGTMRVVMNGETAGTFKILNYASLGHVPTLLGNLTGFQTSNQPASGNATAPKILVQSEYIKAISSAANDNTFVVDDMAILIDLLGGFKTKMAEPASGSQSGIMQSFVTPVPIFVTYVTAWATRDGRMHFRKDIFKRDDTLARMLNVK